MARLGRGGGWRTASLTAISCLAFGSAVAHADTLADAVALAYQTNPTLQGARAQLRALDEGYVQAKSGYRPQLSASAEADYQAGPTTFQAPIHPASASLSLVQPLYTGGFVTAQVRSAEGQIEAGRQKLRQVEADVFQAVIQAYADVRRDEQELDIARDNVAVLRGQLDEAKAKFAVRDVTRTDVAQAEGRFAGAQSQLSSAEAQLSISRSNYAAVVGESPGDLAPEPALAGMPSTAEEALTIAQQDNPNILAADYSEQAAAAQVAEARAAYRPTVSLRASAGYQGYYVSQGAVFPPDQAGVWDSNVTASVVANQPLFAGGMNASKIRQALESDNAQRIAVEVARRQTVQTIAQAWSQFSAAKANVSSNEEQVRANEVAYDGTKQEAEVGLRTTLDVLNAEQELHAAQSALVVARHDQYVASAVMLDAMGRLEIKSISPTTPAYDPIASFRKVWRKGATPLDGVVEALDKVGAPSIRRSAAPGPDALLTPSFHVAGLRGEVDSGAAPH